MSNLAHTAFSLICRAFVVGVTTSLIGLIIPGLVAYKEGIFDAADMAKNRAYLLLPDVQTHLAEYEQLKSAARLKLYQINATFVAPRPLSNDEVTALIAQRTVAQQLEGASPPVKFLPFYLSSAMLLWVLSLTPIAWLALVLYPGQSALGGLSAKRVVATGLLAYLSYQWTVWMRYFVLTNKGRKVIGFANYDVSHIGFWLQELNTILFWLLMALVSYQWLEYAESLSANKIERETTLYDMEKRVSVTFLRWQLASVMLALCFFPFSFFYWDLVVNAGDMRFLPAALILHLMWLVVWAAITTPVFRVWTDWGQYKIHKIEAALKESASDGVIAALNSVEPIGGWAKATSAVLSVVSFFAPIAKAVMSR